MVGVVKFSNPISKDITPDDQPRIFLSGLKGQIEAQSLQVQVRDKIGENIP